MWFGASLRPAPRTCRVESVSPAARAAAAGGKLFSSATRQSMRQKVARRGAKQRAVRLLIGPHLDVASRAAQAQMWQPMRNRSVVATAAVIVSVFFTLYTAVCGQYTHAVVTRATAQLITGGTRRRHASVAHRCTVGYSAESLFRCVMWRCCDRCTGDQEQLVVRIRSAQTVLLVDALPCSVIPT